MAPITILVTGASRGLGKGFVKRCFAQPGNTVVAGVRDPEHPNAKVLAELPQGDGTRLLVVKIDSLVESDPADAVKALVKEGINALDIVVGNAGISKCHPFVSGTLSSLLAGGKKAPATNITGGTSLGDANAGSSRLTLHSKSYEIHILGKFGSALVTAIIALAATGMFIWMSWEPGMFVNLSSLTYSVLFPYANQRQSLSTRGALTDCRSLMSWIKSGQKAQAAAMSFRAEIARRRPVKSSIRLP